jgi:hemimethylated DNA binding protein
MAASAHRALVRATFRGLIRVAHRLDAAGQPLTAELAKFALPAGVPTSAVGAKVTFRDTVVHQYRSHKTAAPGREADALVDIALNALSQANKCLAAVETAASDVKPAEVRYSVGQVIRHKMYGYRAVIIGWDERCQASDKWVAATGTARLTHGASQPFYHCLVDVRDRPDAQISYVAQDNVDLMTPVEGASVKDVSPLDRMVIHPLITRHFDSFKTSEGFYVPGATLSQSYPSETPMSVRSAIALGAPRATVSESESDSDTEENTSRRRGKVARAATATASVFV